MSKNVLLIQPRQTMGWQAHSKVSLPIGLLSVATPVSLAGYNVRIIDQRVEPEWRSYLNIELENEPVCVGISSMTGPQIRYALQISKIVKEQGDIPVIWGGIHPSLLPEQTLRNEYVDIVVQGEGEETFLELVQALERHRSPSTVKGVWHKDDDKMMYTGDRPFSNLDSQPPLAYHLVEPWRYVALKRGAKRLNFVTSRGCPHQCTFCVNTPIHKRKWRCMDSELAVKRVKEFVETYRIGELGFSDMNFFTNMERARDILNGILSENINIAIPKFSVRVDSLSAMSREDFNLLVRAGCTRLTVGVESGSAKVQQLLGKRIDVGNLLEVNRRMKSYPVTPVYLFMMGMPTETIKDLRESVSLATRLVDENTRAAIRFSIYTPYPGTELYDVAVKHGLRVPERLEDWINFNYRNVSPNDPWLETEMRKLIEMIDFCSSFIGKRTFAETYVRPGRFMMALRDGYEPLAKMRLKKFIYHFPLEWTLAKRLGLYSKQI